MENEIFVKGQIFIKGKINPEFAALYKLRGDGLPCSCTSCNSGQKGIGIYVDDDGNVGIRPIFDGELLKSAVSVKSAMAQIKRALRGFIRVKVSDDYVAIVSKKGIAVGCQLISFAAIKKLQKAIDKIQTQK